MKKFYNLGAGNPTTGTLASIEDANEMLYTTVRLDKIDLQCKNNIFFKL